MDNHLHVKICESNNQHVYNKKKIVNTMSIYELYFACVTFLNKTLRFQFCESYYLNDFEAILVPYLA